MKMKDQKVKPLKTVVKVNVRNQQGSWSSPDAHEIREISDQTKNLPSVDLDETECENCSTTLYGVIEPGNA